MVAVRRPVVRAGTPLSCVDGGGAGPPVVLLHGLAGHCGEWDRIAERLHPRFRVIALDQRGHGRSERHPDDVSRAAHVADVVAVLDQLRLPDAVLVGQSLGGHTAMLTTATHPERVRALILGRPSQVPPHVRSTCGGSSGRMVPVRDPRATGGPPLRRPPRRRVRRPAPSSIVTISGADRTSG